MPITLGDLRAARRTIETESVSGVVRFTYKLGEVTSEAIDAAVMDADGKPLAGFDEIIGHLAAWLESWDLMDEGEMYPITFENLRSLPRAFLLDLYGAIHSDVRFRPTRPAGSLGAS